MKIFLLIFSIVSFITAIGSIAFVSVDVVIEKIRQKLEEDDVIVIKTPAPPPPVEPVSEQMPEPIERVSAEDADAMISDSLALSGIIYEESEKKKGEKSFVNIGAINDAFFEGDTVDLDALKQKNLVPKKVSRVKILADGVLSKPLTVKANSYSVQAVKMIELTGGTVAVNKQ